MNFIMEMLKKINDFYLHEIKQLQNQLWEHRRICILQVLKIILTKIFMEKKMDESEFVFILESAEKSVENKFINIEKKDTKDDKLESTENATLDVNSMTRSYLQLVTKFVDKIEPYAGKSYIAKVKSVLFSIISTVESELQKQFRYENQVLVNIYNQSIITMQTILNKNSGQLELLQSYTNAIEEITKNLMGSRQMSKSVGEKHIRSFKEKFDRIWQNLDKGIDKIVAKHLLNIFNNVTPEMNQLVELKNQTLQKLLDNADSGGIEDFIKRYFSIVVQFRAQELAKKFENTKYENTETSKLQQGSRRAMLLNCEKIKSEFCESLVNNKALNEVEASDVSQQLVLKIKKSSEDVSIIDQIQLKLTENEVTSRFSVKKYSEPSQYEEDIFLEPVKAEEYETIKLLLAEQSKFNKSDCLTVLNEYNVALQLFLNNIDIMQALAYQDLDATVMTTNLKILELARQENKLQNEYSIRSLQKATMQTKTLLQQNEENCNQRRMEEFIKTETLRKELACESMANILLDYFYPNFKTTQQQLKLFIGIKDLIYAKVIEVGKLYNKELKQLYDNFIAHSSFITTEYPHTLEMNRQIMKDMLIAKKKLNNAPEIKYKNPNLVKQGSNKDKDDIRLKNKIIQIRNQKVEENIKPAKEPRKVFDFALLCKVAVIGKLTKSQMLRCAQDGLEHANVDENSKKKILSEFSRIWVKVNNEMSKTKKSKSVQKNQTKNTVKKRGNYLNRLAQQQLEASSSSSTTSDDSEY